MHVTIGFMNYERDTRENKIRNNQLVAFKDV